MSNLLRMIFGIVLMSGIGIAACSSSGAETTYTHLLDQIPDTTDTRAGVFLNDMELTAELAGMAPPPEGATSSQVVQYMAEVTRPPMMIYTGHGFASGWSAYAEPFADNAEYRGYDQRHVTASALAGTPPQVYEIIYGRFRPDEFAVGEQCGECPNFQMLEYEGVEWHSWGDGYNEQQNLRIRLSPPVFDQVGRGGNWLVEEDLIFRTLARDDMRTLIDTRSGEIDSLGDRKEFKALANAMTELRAYGIYISEKTIQKTLELYVKPGGYGLTPEQEAALRERLDDIPVLRPYTTYALGSGLDDDGPYSAAAFYFQSPDDASESAGLLVESIAQARTVLDGRPFTQLIVEVETEVDGNILLARLRHREGTRPLWASFLNNNDMSIFAHE